MNWHSPVMRSTGKDEMKSKVGMWLCFACGIVWALVGLRDIFAPRFFTIRPGVMTKVDIGMEFVASVVFLIAAASFYMTRPKVDSIEQG